MTKKQKGVDWHRYAEKYDMLLRYNPFYKQLRREIMDLVRSWSINEDDLIVDAGAGTGNYSIPVARQFPEAKVVHLDNNEEMNKLADKKMRAEGLCNLFICQRSVDEVVLQPGTVKGLISINALYAFPDPHRGLQIMYEWLKPGGFGILVDPGRIVNVINWQLAIGWHLLTRHGWSETLRIFREGKVVSEQNRNIRRMQREGKLWTHSPEEFSEAVASAGFTIKRCRTCFRGLSDLAVVTKN